MHITVFNNFNIMAFDENGEQMPDLQLNLLTLYAEAIGEKGLSLAGQIIETPSGKWRIFETSEGSFNLEQA